MNNSIVIITPYPPPADGIGSHSRHIATALSEVYDVHILAPGPKRGGGTETVVLDNGRTLEVARCLRDRDACSAYLERIGPRWVFCQFAISAFHVATLDAVQAVRSAKQIGARVVIGYHEPSREIPALPIVATMLYRTMLQIGDASVVFSPVAGDALDALGALHVHQVPHGLPVMRGEPAAVQAIRERHGGRFVLALGFIHPDKGIDTLIEAAGMVSADGEPVRYVIAGSPRERHGIFKINGRSDRRHLEQLRTAAARTNASIEFVPYVADQELAAYLQAAAVSVLPYRNGAQSGIASLTIAAGRGAIVSDLPGMRAQFGGGARYFPAGDARALQQQLESVLANGSDALDQAVLERCANETYHTVARRIAAIASGLEVAAE